MYTNQCAALESETPFFVCQHEVGSATIETCRYLQVLHRLRAWVDRAEQAHMRGDCGRESIGELWLLQGEVAYALDHCPNHAAYYAAVRAESAAVAGDGI